jgi:hypothetical protein
MKTKLSPKDRIGKHFRGVIFDHYSDSWLFLEYLGNGEYLVCDDTPHGKEKFSKVKLSEIT